jgi:hypothetical protein
VQAGQGQLEIAVDVGPGLVGAWGLGGRPDEQAGEQVRQARVDLAAGDQRGQEVGADQPRRRRGLGAADRDVVAAARAGQPAVEQVLLGGEPGDQGGVERRAEQLGVGPAARRRRQVDLEDAGVGGDREPGQRGIARRRIALELDGQAGGGAGAIDGGDQG